MSDSTIRDAAMFAIERAVQSCAGQVAADIPPEAWVVDYAGILNAVKHRFPAVTSDLAVENARLRDELRAAANAILKLVEPEPAKVEEPDKVREAIGEVLKTYRLRHTVDDLGDGYPLVDALTPDADDTVERGKDEIEVLADELAEALLALRAAPSGEADKVREAVADIVRHAEQGVNRIAELLGVDANDEYAIADALLSQVKRER